MFTGGPGDSDPQKPLANALEQPGYIQHKKEVISLKTTCFWALLSQSISLLVLIRQPLVRHNYEFIVSGSLVDSFDY